VKIWNDLIRKPSGFDIRISSSFNGDHGCHAGRLVWVEFVDGQ
jgi:hypothetical protein